MVRIKLGGKHAVGEREFALVDNEDAEKVMQHKWHLSKKRRNAYYPQTNIIINGKRTLILMHHLILKKPDKGFETDHINGQGLDNRKENLRLVTRRQNQANRKLRCKDGMHSIYIGVTWCKRRNKWKVQIVLCGRVFNLGHYDDEEQAAQIYDAVAYYFLGDIQELNFPNEKKFKFEDLRNKIPVFKKMTDEEIQNTKINVSTFENKKCDGIGVFFYPKLSSINPYYVNIFFLGKMRGMGHYNAIRKAKIASDIGRLYSHRGKPKLNFPKRIDWYQEVIKKIDSLYLEVFIEKLKKFVKNLKKKDLQWV